MEGVDGRLRARASRCFAGFDLRIDDDDRIALLGANGNGKSTFAKLIAGRLPPSGGTLPPRSAHLQVAYFAQHQLDELNPAQSAYDHVRDADAGRARGEGARPRRRAGLHRAKMDTPARDLSGGEKARLLLGLATFTGANLLILDEPTNHLDIDSREALVRALAEFSGAVILISHDRHLVEASVDRLWLVAGGTVRPFDGDIDDYRRSVLDSRGSNGVGVSAEAGASPDQQRRREAAQKRADAAPLRRRIREIEGRMEKAQKEIAELDEKLADPKLYARNPTDAAFLGKARADAARKLAAAEEEWLTANAEIEAVDAGAG